MPLSRMKRNEDRIKTFTGIVYIKGKGTSTKSVAVKEEETHTRDSH